jgi:putative transposase
LVFFADKGYRGLFHDIWAATGGYCRLELVGGLAGQKGFVVQKKRWIVERTFAWLSWSRRLSKDYEVTTKSAEAWIDVSAIRTTLRKLEQN